MKTGIPAIDRWRNIQVSLSVPCRVWLALDFLDVFLQVSSRLAGFVIHLLVMLLVAVLYSKSHNLQRLTHQVSAFCLVFPLPLVLLHRTSVLRLCVDDSRPAFSVSNLKTLDSIPTVRILQYQSYIHAVP